MKVRAVCQSKQVIQPFSELGNYTPVMHTQTGEQKYKRCCSLFIFQPSARERIFVFCIQGELRLRTAFDWCRHWVPPEKRARSWDRDNASEHYFSTLLTMRNDLGAGKVTGLVSHLKLSRRSSRIQALACLCMQVSSDYYSRNSPWWRYVQCSNSASQSSVGNSFD